MRRNGTRHDECRRPTLHLADAQIQRGIEQSHQPVDVPNKVARPIPDTVAVLKMLRQAFWACREQDAWWWPLKCDLAPDDGLTLTEYSIDDLDRALEALLNRALEALEELDALVKASKRGSAP